MRLSELIQELQRYKRQDAIVVTNDLKPVGRINAAKHGSNTSQDLFISFSFEPVEFNLFSALQVPPAKVGLIESANRSVSTETTDENDDDDTWDNYLTGDPIV